MGKGPTIYGAGVTPVGIYMLGQSYRAHADALEFAPSHIRLHFSDHPRRLLYFQALEHFLRGFLRLNRVDPVQIRAYQHNFTAMLDCGKSHGLRISGVAEEFIWSSTFRNDYVRIRYLFNIEEDLDADTDWDVDPEDLKRESMSDLRQAVFEVEDFFAKEINATGREVILPPEISAVDR